MAVAVPLSSCMQEHYTRPPVPRIPAWLVHYDSHPKVMHRPPLPGGIVCAITTEATKATVQAFFCAKICGKQRFKVMPAKISDGIVLQALPTVPIA